MASERRWKGIIALYTRWLLSLGWMFVLLRKWIVYSCLRNVCISSDERPLWLMWMWGVTPPSLHDAAATALSIGCEWVIFFVNRTPNRWQHRVSSILTMINKPIERDTKTISIRWKHSRRCFKMEVYYRVDASDTVIRGISKSSRSRWLYSRSRLSLASERFCGFRWLIMVVVIIVKGKEKKKGGIGSQRCAQLGKAQTWYMCHQHGNPEQVGPRLICGTSA